MPTYSALGTKVSLHMWDPFPLPPMSNDNDGSAARSASSSPWLKKRSGSSDLDAKNNAQADPSVGHLVTQLSDSYFADHGGLDILGDEAMPFYMINAGKELFNNATPEHEINHPDNAALAGRVPGSSQVSNRADLSNISSSLLDDGDDPDSSLSSLDTDQFESGDDVPEPAPYRMQTRRSSAKSANTVTDPIPKPTSSPKYSSPKSSNMRPIKVSITPSSDTFMPSLNTDIPHDICVNIFFNGELSASRIIRAETRPEEKVLNYSGRRVDASLEVPWAIELLSQANKKTKVQTAEVTGEQRWNNINSMLLAEAEEWGYQGRWRDVMGAYLVEISKKPVPEVLKNVKASRFGIIDVVITLGTTVPVTRNNVALTEPRRKLFQSVIGLDENKELVSVPQEPRRKNEDKSAQTNLKDESETAHLETDQSTDKVISQPQFYSISQSGYPSAMVQQGNPSIKPENTNVGAGAFSQEVKSPETPPHHGRPKNIPSKRFKGSENVSPDEQSPNKSPPHIPRRSTRSMGPSSEASGKSDNEKGHLAMTLDGTADDEEDPGPRKDKKRSKTSSLSKELHALGKWQVTEAQAATDGPLRSGKVRVDAAGCPNSIRAPSARRGSSAALSSTNKAGGDRDIPVPLKDENKSTGISLAELKGLTEWQMEEGPAAVDAPLRSGKNRRDFGRPKTPQATTTVASSVPKKQNRRSATQSAASTTLQSDENPTKRVKTEAASGDTSTNLNSSSKPRQHWSKTSSPERLARWKKNVAAGMRGRPYTPAKSEGESSVDKPGSRKRASTNELKNPDSKTPNPTTYSSVHNSRSSTSKPDVSATVSKENGRFYLKAQNVPKEWYEKNQLIPVAMPVKEEGTIEAKEPSPPKSAASGKVEEPEEGDKAVEPISSMPEEDAWKPTEICQNSILRYPTASECWDGTEYDPRNDNVVRFVADEREDVFRSSGVLMGVRFVVGS